MRHETNRKEKTVRLNPLFLILSSDFTPGNSIARFLWSGPNCSVSFHIAASTAVLELQSRKTKNTFQRSFHHWRKYFGAGQCSKIRKQNNQGVSACSTRRVHNHYYVVELCVLKIIRAVPPPQLFQIEPQMIL